MKYLAMLLFLVSCGPKVGECYKRENIFNTGSVSTVREVLDFGLIFKSSQDGREFYRTFKFFKENYTRVDCAVLLIKDVQ